MATLTLDVPDTVAQTVAQLSEVDRAAYLARVNAFAVATLSNDETDDENDLPDDIYLTHPLPPSLTQSLADDMREAREAIDAGQVINGETFLADLRRRAAENRAEADARRVTAIK